MDAIRYLVVTADDYGIGPETSRAIRELASRGLVTASVLLVNSPHAVEAVRAWRQSGVSLELGWHPCLTLDRPVAPQGQVPSLVGPDGRFWPLGRFLARLLRRQIKTQEIEKELCAQHRRFIELIGQPPTLVNSHQHVSVFPPVGRILHGMLAEQHPLPYVRRVREPWSLLRRVPGARAKRMLLTTLGRQEARALDRGRFPGCAWLAGITNPPCVAAADFFARWLRYIPGDTVELMCHPGHLDASLLGRDAHRGDGQLERRVQEHALLLQPAFDDACRAAGFRRVSPMELRAHRPGGLNHAA
jgi:predicted glycoside hydrolase/deacetylase ChbG (UPF0249 family)